VSRHTCAVCKCPLAHTDSIKAGVCVKHAATVEKNAGALYAALEDLRTCASVALGELSGNSIVVDELARYLNQANQVLTKAGR
jgi:hypothetical protein